MLDMEADTSLSMTGLPSLMRLQSQGNSFVWVRRMDVTDVPNLDNVQLNAFLLMEEDNFSCNNCAALTVHYHGYKLLQEVVNLSSDISQIRSMSSEALTSIQSASQDLKCYEKEDTFFDRRRMLLDCKNYLDQLESAFNLDIRESLSNEKSESKKSRSKVGAAVGLGALGVISLVCPFFGAAAATVGECFLLGAGGGAAASVFGVSAYNSNEQAKEAKKRGKQYANDADRDRDFIKRIKKLKDSYREYYSLLLFVCLIVVRIGSVVVLDTVCDYSLNPNGINLDG